MKIANTGGYSRFIEVMDERCAWDVVLRAGTPAHSPRCYLTPDQARALAIALIEKAEKVDRQMRGRGARRGGVA